MYKTSLPQKLIISVRLLLLAIVLVALLSVIGILDTGTPTGSVVTNDISFMDLGRVENNKIW